LKTELNQGIALCAYFLKDVTTTITILQQKHCSSGANHSQALGRSVTNRSVTL